MASPICAAPLKGMEMVDRPRDFLDADAEIAAQLGDALRYRWLREQHESSDSDETMCVFRPDVGRGCLMPVSIEPGQLDAAIDAARKGAA